jgi:hypothetical protein
MWGWLWSPGAELLAWWFLAKRTRTTWVVGALATIVVVGGPMAQMALPVITEAQQEAHKRESLQSRIQTLTADIAAARKRAEAHREQAAELQHYSDGRHQRQVALAKAAEQSAQRLRRKRETLQARLAGRAGKGTVLADQLQLILHAGILLVAWAGSVSAVAHLSGLATTGVTPQSPMAGASEGGCNGRNPGGDWRVTVANRLREHMCANDLTQKQVAQAVGIKRPQVSLALAHQQRSREARRTASGRTFDQLAKYLDS